MGELTGDEFANTPGGFQEVANCVQGHFYEPDHRVGKAHDETRHHIDCAIKD